MSLYQVQRLFFDIHNDLDLRKNYLDSPESIAKPYDLSDTERLAIISKDMKSLYQMGVNPWLLFQFAHMVGIRTDEYLKQIREV
jgi:Aromatic-ring-opening dioxygenase LigAB, LigA subunit